MFSTGITMLLCHTVKFSCVLRFGELGVILTQYCWGMFPSVGCIQVFNILCSSYFVIVALILETDRLSSELLISHLEDKLFWKQHVQLSFSIKFN